MQETLVWFWGQEGPLEKGRATHSNNVAWRIPVDRGAWWATVHGVANNLTLLSDYAQHNGVLDQFYLFFFINYFFIDV